VCIGSIGPGIAALWPRRYTLLRRSMLRRLRGRCLPRFRTRRDPRPGQERERERIGKQIMIMVRHAEYVNTFSRDNHLTSYSQ